MYKDVNIFLKELSYDTIIIGDFMEEKKLSIDDFMHMFATVCFLQEQRYFNVDNLKGFMKIYFKLKDEEEEIVYNEVDSIIDKMIKEGYLDVTSNYEYLVKINDTIPFMTIITKNFDYLNSMIKFFYKMLSYSYQENRIDYSIKEDESFIKLDKVYKKERNVK